MNIEDPTKMDTLIHVSPAAGLVEAIVVIAPIAMFLFTKSSSEPLSPDSKLNTRDGASWFQLVEAS